MKARDRVAAGALRSVLGALDNAEAVETPPTSTAADQRIRGGRRGRPRRGRGGPAHPHRSGRPRDRRTGDRRPARWPSPGSPAAAIGPRSGPPGCRTRSTCWYRCWTSCRHDAVRGPTVAAAGPGRRRPARRRPAGRRLRRRQASPSCSARAPTAPSVAASSGPRCGPPATARRWPPDPAVPARHHRAGRRGAPPPCPPPASSGALAAAACSSRTATGSGPGSTSDRTPTTTPTTWWCPTWTRTPGPGRSAPTTCSGSAPRRCRWPGR